MNFHDQIRKNQIEGELSTGFNAWLLRNTPTFIAILQRIFEKKKNITVDEYTTGSQQGLEIIQNDNSGDEVYTIEMLNSELLESQLSVKQTIQARLNIINARFYLISTEYAKTHNIDQNMATASLNDLKDKDLGQFIVLCTNILNAAEEKGIREQFAELEPQLKTAYDEYQKDRENSAIIFGNFSNS